MTIWNVSSSLESSGGNSFTRHVELQFANMDFGVSSDGDPWCRFRSGFPSYISDTGLLFYVERRANEFSAANAFDMTISHRRKGPVAKPDRGEIEIRVTEIGIQIGTGGRRGRDELTKWYKMKTQVV